LFGGSVDRGEEPADALRRELREELDLAAPALRLLSRFQFDLVSLRFPPIYRAYYEVRLPAAAVAALRLGEGAALGLFDRAQMLTLPRLAPYDAFALWFHANEFRLHA
jgi:8-oxo-dGTP pyrophosphatase MutT (NUDIX family)